MKFKKGDIVYGYCVNHKRWDYCVLGDIFDDWVFGYDKDGKGGYYQMKPEDIVPEEIANSPLWKALE